MSSNRIITKNCREQRLFATTWSGRRDSNSRHPPWQGGTLPLSYYRMLRLLKLVRAKRLELIRLSAPDPKSGASAIPPRPRIEAQPSSPPWLNTSHSSPGRQRRIFYLISLRMSSPKMPFFSDFQGKARAGVPPRPHRPSEFSGRTCPLCP